MRKILPAILTLITGRERHFPVVEWSDRLWSYNAFRVLEQIFGRAYGKNGIGDTIRAEQSVSAEMIDGVLYVERQFFTLEAVIGHAEGIVRTYLAKAFEPRPEFGFMPQPVYLTLCVLGLKLSLSGDMNGFLAPFIGMAIAYDNSSTGGNTSSATLTFALTVGGGSNRALCSGFTANKGSLPSITGVTYAGNAMTASANSPKLLPVDTSVRVYFYYQLNPTTGANNEVITFAATTDETRANAVAYSGVGSFPQDTSINGTGTSGTLTMTTTVDNSWLVGVFRNNNDGNGSAGASTTRRSFVSGQNGFYDSNGAKTPVGSYSIISTWGGSAEYAGIGMSMAPPGTLYTPTYTESKTATDDLIVTVQRTLAESKTATDDVLAAPARILTESKTATDTFASAFIILETLSEAVSAVDSMIRSGIRTLTESLTATALSIQEGAKNLLESITASDTFLTALAFGRILTESVSANDTIRKLLNGSATIWEDLTKSVSSWINREKT